MIVRACFTLGETKRAVAHGAKITSTHIGWTTLEFPTEDHYEQWVQNETDKFPHRWERQKMAKTRAPSGS